MNNIFEADDNSTPLTEEEKATLDTLRMLNGDTYELVSENITNANENAEKISEFESKILKCDATISTLTTERDNSVNSLFCRFSI